MKEINLKNMSAVQLKKLACKASSLAKDLEKSEPSYDLALEAGVIDASYDTIRDGWVAHYRGEAVITMDDGRKWKAVGHGTQGTPHYVSQEGYIEFIPLN